VSRRKTTVTGGGGRRDEFYKDANVDNNMKAEKEINWEDEEV
jgi:hypothetical protein